MQTSFTNPLVYQARQQMFIKGLVLAAVAALMVQMPAEAQSLKDTGVSVFNAIYGVVGVCGAIAVVVTGINWAWGNFLGHGDPKKLFFQAVLGTGIALGAVAIIQFIKDAVGSNNGGIGNL